MAKERGESMARSRANWRAKQKAKYKEEMLDKRNGNVNDPTPYEAMKRICNAEKQSNKNR